MNWNIIQLCLVVLGATILQVSVVPHISIAGAKPDVILIVAALYGFAFGPRVGGITGFFGGFISDLIIGPYVGLGLISKSLVGFFAGFVQKMIFVENIILPMLAIFIATLIHELIYVLFLFLFGDTVSIQVLIKSIVLPSAVYNAILTPFVYVLVRKFLEVKQEMPTIKRSKLLEE